MAATGSLRSAGNRETLAYRSRRIACRESCRLPGRAPHVGAPRQPASAHRTQDNREGSVLRRPLLLPAISRAIPVRPAVLAAQRRPSSQALAPRV